MSGAGYLALGIVLSVSVSANIVGGLIFYHWQNAWKIDGFKALGNFLAGMGRFRERILIIDVGEGKIIELHGCDDCRAKLKTALRDADLFPSMATADLDGLDADGGSES